MRKDGSTIWRPLLIGESPSASGDRFYMFPLSGQVAKTLCGLAGIAPIEGGTRYGRWTWALYDHFDCANVFARHRDATPWRAHEALLHFENILAAGAKRPIVVVCLGRRVQRAALDYFGDHVTYDGDDFYDWNIGEWGGDLVDFVAIPHPSGLNRTLNDAGQRELCGATLREALTRPRASRAS